MNEVEISRVVLAHRSIGHGPVRFSKNKTFAPPETFDGAPFDGLSFQFSGNDIEIKPPERKGFHNYSMNVS